MVLLENENLYREVYDTKLFWVESLLHKKRYPDNNIR